MACELVVEHAVRRHALAAEVVFVKDEGPGKGVGVQLAPMNEAAREALREFVECRPAPAEVEEQDEEPPGSGSGTDEDPHGPLSLHERMRSLSIQEQQRVAASGTMSERVMLERLYGPNVWETLLRNPRLTVPEVARIGRKGTLPRPLVEAIAANATWLQAGEVQRALLSNTRSSPAVVERVLRSLSRPDLLLVPQQTAYPAVVRQAAKHILGMAR